MFKTRSEEPERIDTGDYTEEEYETFLREIRWINRYIGDERALRKSLSKRLDGSSIENLSVLDVGAGSGELLRSITKFFPSTGTKRLVGLDNNFLSAKATVTESKNFPNVFAVCSDALNLPFEDSTFDFVISSLFTHHLTDSHIVTKLAEMKRVSRRGVIVIDLHRHRIAYLLYRIMCKLFRISELVTHDGSLSVLKGFKPAELNIYARKAGFENIKVERSFPFRLILSSFENVS